VNPADTANILKFCPYHLILAKLSLIEDATGRANDDNSQSLADASLFSSILTPRRHSSVPSVYISASLQDPRIPAWHPAKFAAAYRLLLEHSKQTTAHNVLLNISDGGGHFGLGGRYGKLDEIASEYEFLAQQTSS
jgi:prolyl oligopeptidase PreP (S9A serine peptidase family)